jgi:hypothetical protein
VEYGERPWGDERDDLRIAQLCALVASGLGAKKVKLSDFMFSEQKRKKKTKLKPEQMFGLFKAQTDAINTMKAQNKKKK